MVLMAGGKTAGRGDRRFRSIKGGLIQYKGEQRLTKLAGYVSSRPGPVIVDMCCSPCCSDSA